MRKRLKRIFSAALAGIVFCTAITFYPVETKAAETAADIWEGVSSADWMSYLDDNLKISQINLPGTHDSGTKRVKLSFIDATASASVFWISVSRTMGRNCGLSMPLPIVNRKMAVIYI